MRDCPAIGRGRLDPADRCGSGSRAIVGGSRAEAQQWEPRSATSRSMPRSRRGPAAGAAASLDRDTALREQVCGAASRAAGRPNRSLGGRGATVSAPRPSTGSSMPRSPATRTIAGAITCRAPSSSAAGAAGRAAPGPHMRHRVPLAEASGGS